MPGNVDLSVVIVSHNVGPLLGSCLVSVFRECAGMPTEVFVVDSASTDGTVQLVQDRFPEVRLRASPENIGFPAGNNLAIPECRGRYILLLNPDTLVQEGALRSLMRYLDQHPSVGAVGPTLRLANGEIQPECARNLPTPASLLPWLLLLDKLEWQLRFRRRYRSTAVHPPRGTLLDRFNLLSWKRDQTCEVEYICGAGMMLRREVIQQIGLLDETSPLYLDDLDYCRRIREAGWQIHFVAGPTITHFWQQSSSGFKREGDFYAMICHAMWLYFRKHHGRAAAMRFSAIAAAATVLRLPTCLLALLLPGRSWRTFWRRQLRMVLGLGRWAFQVPKSAPRFGFACEAQAVAGVRHRFLDRTS